MFEEISMEDKTAKKPENELEKRAKQEQAYEKLERDIAECTSIEAVKMVYDAWLNEHHITDLDTFFHGNTELADKVRNLIDSKLEELKIKEEQEKSLANALAMVAQKRTFYRLYSILSEAKNYKDFEKANEKLKDWLKDHPEKTWEQFSKQYQNYFKKVANEDHLKYLTGKAKQDEIVSRLEEIYEHSVNYSDYAFFHENIQQFQSDYSTRDQFLSAEQKERIEALIKDGYERLMPPEITENQIAEFDSQNGAFVYQSLASSLSSSSSKETALMDWLALNGSTLTDLGSNDKAKISELLMQKFKINIIPGKFDYSAKSIEDDTSVKNVQANTINYVLYKLNSSDGVTMGDIGIFQAASVKSGLSEIAPGLEPTIEEAVINKLDVKEAEELTAVEQPDEQLADKQPDEQLTNEQPDEQLANEQPDEPINTDETLYIAGTLVNTTESHEKITLEASTPESTSIDTPMKFTEPELEVNTTTTEEPIIKVENISEDNTPETEPTPILAEESEPEEDSTLKTEATIEAEPIIEETDLDEPNQSISQKEILVEPVLEADAEEPIQSVSQEEVLNNTITPEHETIEDPERTHVIKKIAEPKIEDLNTASLETSGVPERIGEEPTATKQTNFDTTNEKEDKGKDEINDSTDPSTPRLVALFRRLRSGPDSIAIDALPDPRETKRASQDNERGRRRNF